ncbi:amino acid adenylation domain-containing protein [Inquilinus sp.]|uniref:amino acid adenylation domain-containing protein n=1 Tax=Inquilinus sp. TaxID=1932117 RepID=UPI0037835E01
MRIEPGEIEAALDRLPGIRHSVVLARDHRGDRQLVAYYAADTALDPVLLRRALADTLPDAMVPAAFVQLADLPLTSSGKVDRNALPDPVQTQADTPAADGIPRDPLEAALARIFAEVLHLEAVSISDDFFALGGHSLRATQVISRLRAALEVDLPVKAVFEHPTVLRLAPVVTAALRDGGTAEAEILPWDRTGEPPLSFAQERLWFLHGFSPEAALYNVPAAFRIRGGFDPSAFAAAANGWVADHEILRTRFAADGGSPAPVVDPPHPLAIPVEPVDPAMLGSVLSAEARRPFDLSRDPPVRFRILRLGPEDHAVVVNQHHIVCDGWSVGLMLRALSERYAAALAGHTVAPPRLHYADFAQWQRQRLQGEKLARDLDFWKRTLADASVLALPSDHPRPPQTNHRGATFDFTLEAGTTAALRQLAVAHGATLFTTLLSVFAVLLGRLSGQADIVIGTPVANRTHLATEAMPGQFANTLVLRTDIGGDPSFTTLMRRTIDAALSAYAHQDLPFEVLVDALGVPRDPSRTPLFQVFFILQNAHDRIRFAAPDLVVRPLPIDYGMAKFDLTLSFEEQDDRIDGTFEYATDLFEPATIARMAGHFRQLLDRALAAPEVAIGELPLLTGPEVSAIAGWNATAAPFSADRTMVDLIADQAARTPEATAAVFEDGRLSYRDLDRAANRLAHLLQARHLALRGVPLGPDTPIGLCLERGLGLIVAVLGVLKAGAAYLPLDPSYPEARLAAMIEDSGAPLIITDDGLASRLPPMAALDPARRLSLDGEAAALAAMPGEAPDPVAGPESLAYVIYTSGSTGRPKGVMVEHRSLVNRIEWMQAAYPIGPGDRVLQKTPYSFDVSVWELVWPLATGATMVFARPEGHKDPAYLYRLIQDAGITVLHFVPSMLQAFLEQPGIDRLASLRLLFCSGEALPTALTSRLLAALPDLGLHNLYGPTEAAVDVSFHACTAADEERHGPTTPIGRPVWNTTLEVLDAQRRRLPVGVPGELYLGGVQLARGYLNRADLTAERFVANPFGPGRLYRTGDLVRRQPDGAIAYLGRTDFQVKIRGVRIEPGEIEAALDRLPGIRHSVVLARDHRGDRQLVAYYAADTALDPVLLRRALADTLPDAMVPAAFVQLTDLPLTSSGKVDRNALPEPERDSPVAAPVEPRSAMEQRIAEIWREILGLAVVGTHDGFFELGGTSLMAMRVQARLRETLGIDIPVVALFAHPTVASLAGHLDHNDAQGDILARARARAQARHRPSPRGRGRPAAE